MTILSKLTDALSMFWQALDEEERRIVLYLGVYVTLTVAMALRAMADERRETRLRREILAELRGDGAPH